MGRTEVIPYFRSKEIVYAILNNKKASVVDARKETIYGDDDGRGDYMENEYRFFHSDGDTWYMLEIQDCIDDDNVWHRWHRILFCDSSYAMFRHRCVSLLDSCFRDWNVIGECVACLDRCSISILGDGYLEEICKAITDEAIRAKIRSHADMFKKMWENQRELIHRHQDHIRTKRRKNEEKNRN